MDYSWNQKQITIIEQQIVELELRVEMLKKKRDLLVFKNETKEKKRDKINTIIKGGRK